LRQAIVAGFDWVDLETDIADSIPRFKGVRRIVSYHNMQEMPSDLEKIHAAMCKQDADVVKIAVRAQSPLDNLRVLGLLRNPPKPTVAMCMGDMGMPSRLLGRLFGTPWTYAAWNKERNVAPGLPTYYDLRRVYHYDRINPNTKVYALLGDPVGQSLSPLAHNTAFRALDINAIYVPIRVPRADLRTVIKEFEKMPVHGYSVTIPHKEAAATLAKHRDQAVDRTQAANTLVRSGDGSFIAYNTDYQGALDSLQHCIAPPPEKEAEPVVASTAIVTEAALSAFQQQPSPAPVKPPEPPAAPETIVGKNVLILGAGGVARAIAHGLQSQQCAITVANRTAERAHKLAEEVGCRFIEWSGRHSVFADILVNCTPVGMHPNLDDSPMHFSYLSPNMIVFDTVYNPETTMLIKEARERGCRVLTGVDMFVRQAALQFELFTGRKAPIDLMSETVRQALSPVVPRPDEDDEL
jgi:3-dehydroquinate dehydratase/shikimate dehydrogenase